MNSGESAAREQWMEDAARELWRDETNVTSWTEHDAVAAIVAIIAHHYAAREREVQELVKALTAATRCPTCDGTGKMTVECISCCYGEVPNPAGGVCTCSEETCAQCDGKGWATADGTGEELVAAALALFAAKGETGSVAAQGEQHD